MSYYTTMSYYMVHNIDDGLQSEYPSLGISVMNVLLRNNNVIVTLQWPREAGAVYHVDILPETGFNELIYTNLKAMSQNTITTNVTFSYNVQYNVSIVSSLCGVTTTEMLNYGK